MATGVLGRMVFGNTVEDYLLFLAVFLGGVLLVVLFRRVILSRLRSWAERTSTTLDDFVVDVFRKSLVPLAYYGVFFLATRNLVLSRFAARVVEVAGILLLTVIAVQFTISLVRWGVERYLEKRERDPSRERALKGFQTLLKVVVWGLGSVFLLDNLGFRISAVVAGLGIGGVAVALASQAILGDLFSYFTIMFDRPFEIGDLIVVGEFTGTVERLGIKSARLASIDGEQIIISNKDLTDSRVRNYKRMERRRVLVRLGVTYQTAHDRLAEVPGIVEGIVSGVEGATFERAHFASFGESALVFEVAYHVAGNDLRRHMDVRHAVNLAICDAFAARGIAFAYPTRTVFLARDG